MGFDLKRSIYERTPLFVKKLLHFMPFAVIAGRRYRDTLARGKYFTSASREQILTYQQKVLQNTLEFVTEQVPAYKHLQRVVRRLPGLDAIKEFPLIDKDILQDNLYNYLPKDFEKIPHYKATTGGTSGNQLTLYLDDQSQSIEMGFVHRYWALMGYAPRHRKATFRGVFFENLPDDQFWQYNPIYNELQFSPFHMSENNLSRYVEQLIRYNPKYIHGYPSAIDTLAEYVLRNCIESKLPKIKAAFLASEGCTTFHRERIETAFRTRVFSWYGHTERLIFGGECEKTTFYHQVPDYGFLEIINDNGTLCENYESGEIVGTSFINRSLPLVRYRTGDYAQRIDHHCECGRNWDRFKNVEGRWKQEMIIGKNGAPISIAALNMHGSIFDRVIRFQYYQECPGVCELRLMVSPGFTDVDKTAIYRKYLSKVGSEVDFKVVVVHDIPLTKRGKVKSLISMVNSQ